MLPQLTAISTSTEIESILSCIPYNRLHSASPKKPIFYKENQSNKLELQKFLMSQKFSHRIDIPQIPDNPYQRDEIVQRLREIEFRINKYFLKAAFTKFDIENRFHFVVFQQETKCKKHYHALLHTPDKSNFRDKHTNQPFFDEMKTRIIRSKIHLFHQNMSRHKCISSSKIFSCETMQIKPEELRITPIDDPDASIIYNSRDYEKDPDNLFFVSHKIKRFVSPHKVVSAFK